ncbi:MAG TPA: hypothetical protein VGM86_13540 [Thermoanaerobaculia bacterium]|jgi:hypothetical protein
MNDSGASFLFGLLLGAISLVIIRLILRWFLGVSSLQKRVEVLERGIALLRNPGPPPALSPQEMTVIAGDPPLSLTDLPGELSLLTLANGRPGLTRLAVTVNGVSYELSELADGEERKLDLSDSMQMGDRNVLTIRGEGAETASARVRLTTF